ncbi:MAG: hypothetical protein QM676_00475 [Novosphingobium sp.]
MLRYVGLHTLPIYVAQVPLIAAILALMNLAGAARLGAGVVLLCPLVVIVVAVIALKLRDVLLAVGASWFYRMPRLHLSAKPAG